MLRRYSKLARLTVALAALSMLMATDAGVIVGGELDGDGHPNVALIVMVNSQGGLLDACSGTLIAPTVVLTSAHCSGAGLGGVVAAYRVTFRPSLRLVDNRYVVEDFILGSPHAHPLYAPTEGGGAAAYDANERYDLGVLVLDRPAGDLYPGITPAPLPAKGTLDGYRTGTRNRYFTHVGYGVQRSGAPGQPDSQFIDFTRRTTTAPLKKLTAELLFTQGVPNDARGGGGICYGDSGGPMLLGSVVVAVNTFVPNETCQNTNGGPRVDTDVARNFLREYVTLP